MKVRELIACLSRAPQEAEVVFTGFDVDIDGPVLFKADDVQCTACDFVMLDGSERFYPGAEG